MAAIKALKGTAILIQLGNGASPEVFAHDCMINLARTVTFEAAMVEDMIESCDDPDAPATVYAFKASIKFSVQGAGKLNSSSIDTWLDFFENKDPKNCKVVFNATGADGGQTVACQMHCSKFVPVGEPHKNADVTVELVSNGPWTRTDNA